MDKRPEEAAFSSQGVALGFDERPSQEALTPPRVWFWLVPSGETTAIRKWSHSPFEGGVEYVPAASAKAAEQRGYRAGLEKAAGVAHAEMEVLDKAAQLTGISVQRQQIMRGKAQIADNIAQAIRNLINTPTDQ